MSIPEYYKKSKWHKPTTYAVKHRDNKIRLDSRSGGVFTSLSDYIFTFNGVVYGCVLDKTFNAVHVRAEEELMRNRMRGSKYIQSDIQHIYKDIQNDLEKGNKVLFTGTSCQVTGLKSYLQTNYEELFCVDIVCHGVPSPKVWQDYLKWQEKKHRSKIKSVEFRNKKDFGWKDHIETLYFENREKVNSRIFATLFYGNSIIRPCCYKCPYKDIIHPGNITIADYWGIDKIDSKFNDNKGVSLVLINDDKGQQLFDAVKNNLSIIETKIEDSLQQPLIKPYSEPFNRNVVWEDYLKLSFVKVAKKYGGYGFCSKVKNKLKAIKCVIFKINHN